MLRQNGTANSKGYHLGAMLGGTNVNNACAIPHEMKCKHTMPLVLPDQSAIEIIEIILRSGKKGKRLNNISESVPAKHGRKENLTEDDIPTIVEAVLDTTGAHANPEPGSECPAICNIIRRVTCRSNDTRSHHARETSSISNETRDDNTSTINQDVDEYNYLLSTFA